MRAYVILVMIKINWRTVHSVTVPNIRVSIQIMENI